MEFAHSIGRKGNCTGEFDRPRSLAITAEGNIVVADTGELSFFVCDAFDQRTFLSDNFSYFCQSLSMSLRICYFQVTKGSRCSAVTVNTYSPLVTLVKAQGSLKDLMA